MTKINLPTPPKSHDGSGKDSEAITTRKEYIEPGFGTYHTQ